MLFKKAGAVAFILLPLLLASAPSAQAMYSYTGMVSTLKALASRPLSPDGPRLEIIRIGTTVKGRAILMVKLSAPGGESQDGPVPLAPLPDIPTPQAPGSEDVAPGSPDDSQESEGATPARGDSRAGRSPVVHSETDDEENCLDADAAQALVLNLEPAGQSASAGSAAQPASADGVLSLLPVEPEPSVPDNPFAGSYPRRLLILCRQHGNEPASTEGAMRFLREYATTTDPAKIALLQRVTFFVIPMLNADGAERYERHNAHDVDLNRAWEYQAQPEIRAALQGVRECRPDLVVDAHELAVSDWTGNFVEAMGQRAGAPNAVGEANNAAIAAVVGQLRARSMKINARPVYHYREPRLAHRFLSVRCGIPSVLIETRRSGGLELKWRAAVHYNAILALGRFLAGEELHTPPRVIEAWLEGQSHRAHRAPARRHTASSSAVARALAQRRRYVLASRGGYIRRTVKHHRRRR